MTTLNDFIRSRGRKACAELFGLELGTVDSYLYAGRRPSVETAKQIIRRSEGALTWESIYGDPADEAA